MITSLRERIKEPSTAWSPYLLLPAGAVFLTRMGRGVIRGVGTNFFVDVLGSSGDHHALVVKLEPTPVVEPQVQAVQ